MIRRTSLFRLGHLRHGLLAAAVVAAAFAVLTAVAPASEPAPVKPVALADRLEPRTWAMALPLAWLATPLDGLRPGDVLDLIGTRTSERATASEIAAGLRVVAIDEQAVVVELTAADASAIAAARGRGLSFVPILRSSR